VAATVVFSCGLVFSLPIGPRSRARSKYICVLGFVREVLARIFVLGLFCLFEVLSLLYCCGIVVGENACRQQRRVWSIYVVVVGYGRRGCLSHVRSC
jgi:hypothetical protein